MISNNKNTSIIKKHDDRIYYNINISGNSGVPNPLFFGYTPAIYNEQLNQSVINNPSDYYLSIVRFTVPTAWIPIFIFEAQGFPNDMIPGLGIYSFDMEYNGNFSGQTFVMLITSMPTAERPKPPTIDNPQWARTPYYYVYNYTDFIIMLNNALASAFASLPLPPVGSTAPFFTYDATTQLISLWAPKAFYDLSLPLPIKIFFNSALQRFFYGFSYIFFSNGDPSGRDCQFNITDLHNNTTQLPNVALLPPPQPITYLVITQNYNTLSNWNSFKSLKIVTNMMPIVNEYTPSVQQLQNNSGIVNLLGVITDFEPLISDRAEERTSVQFQLDGPYRLINMTDINPLSKIDIGVYWTDEILDNHIVYIPQDQVLSLKMVFIKKSTFQGY